MKPRLGAKKGSKQASATDVITSNTVLAGEVGVSAGPGGAATAGIGGSGTPPGANGTPTPGAHGKFLAAKHAEGGRMATFGPVGNAKGDNVSVTNNHATTDPNIDGTPSP